MYKIIFIAILSIVIGRAQQCDCPEETLEKFSSDIYFCEQCNGDGFTSDFPEGVAQCKYCKGLGEIHRINKTYECHSCSGTGLARICWKCFGIGFTKSFSTCKCGSDIRIKKNCQLYIATRAPTIVQKLMKYIAVKPDKVSYYFDEHVILNALLGLTILREEAAIAIPSVISVLKCEFEKEEKSRGSFYIQVMSAKFLIKIGSPAIPHIVDLLSEDSARLKAFAMWLIEEKPQDISVAIPYLKILLNNKDKQTRELAKKVLDRITKKQNSKK